MSQKRKIILLDADVIIHFMKAEKHFHLPKILPSYRLCVLDIVVEKELRRYKKGATEIDNLILFKTVEELSFPKNDFKSPIFKEFMQISRNPKRGIGESACMAYARFNQNILASSNLIDIKDYCLEHNIEYLTTMDTLCEAIQQGVFTEADCDDFIFIVKYEGSKLPVNKMSEFNCNQRIKPIP